MLRFRRPGRARGPVAPGVIALDDPVLCERVAVIGLTAHDVSIVASWRDAYERAAPVMLHEIHDRLRRHDAARRVEGGVHAAPHRALLTTYTASLFAGRIDAAYLAPRGALGALYAAAGVDTADLSLVFEIVRGSAARAIAAAGARDDERTPFAESLGRMLAFDLALVMRAALGCPVGPTADDAQARLIADGRVALAGLLAADLRPRTRGPYGPPLDALASALDRGLDHVERMVRRAARVAHELAVSARELTAGSGSVARGTMATADALRTLAEELRAVATDGTAESGARGERLARAITTLDGIETQARRTAANADVAAQLAARLNEDATRFARTTASYTLREASDGPHPRRRRTDVARTEPLPPDEAPEPAPGDVPAAFRRERRRSLFTDN